MKNCVYLNTSSAADQAADTSGPSPVASFQFKNRPVRVITKDGVEFFIAKDLAPILGYCHAREAIRTRVDRRDRITVRNPDGIPARGNPMLLAVNESGVYALVLGSTKPEALEFRYWLTSQVLPTLRKTGRYEVRRAPAFLEEISAKLRGRGAAKKRQLNRVVAHRDGTLSLRVGKHWLRRVESNSIGFPLAHGLREGLALGLLHQPQKPEGRPLLH